MQLLLQPTVSEDVHALLQEAGSPLDTLAGDALLFRAFRALQLGYKEAGKVYLTSGVSEAAWDAIVAALNVALPQHFKKRYGGVMPVAKTLKAWCGRKRFTRTGYCGTHNSAITLLCTCAAATSTCAHHRLLACMKREGKVDGCRLKREDIWTTGAAASVFKLADDQDAVPLPNGAAAANTEDPQIRLQAEREAVGDESEDDAGDEAGVYRHRC